MIAVLDQFSSCFRMQYILFFSFLLRFVWFVSHQRIVHFEWPWIKQYSLWFKRAQKRTGWLAERLDDPNRAWRSHGFESFGSRHTKTISLANSSILDTDKGKISKKKEVNCNQNWWFKMIVSRLKKAEDDRSCPELCRAPTIRKRFHKPSILDHSAVWKTAKSLLRHNASHTHSTFKLKKWKLNDLATRFVVSRFFPFGRSHLYCFQFPTKSLVARRKNLSACGSYAIIPVGASWMHSPFYLYVKSARRSIRCRRLKTLGKPYAAVFRSNCGSAFKKMGTEPEDFERSFVFGNGF